MIVKPPELIAFDLDGTLVDSAPDLHASINAMQQQLGGPTYNEEQVRSWIGDGTERLVHRALANSLNSTAQNTQFSEAIGLFEQAYSDYNGVYSRLFPGVIDGLNALTMRFPLVCVTNKPARFTKPLLAAFNLNGYFETVLSGDSLAHQKPHPQPLLYAAERLGVSPTASLLIGDSITDIKAARAAGFAVICVSYGYDSSLDPQAMYERPTPDAFIDSLTQLGAYWANHPTLRDVC